VNWFPPVGLMLFWLGAGADGDADGAGAVVLAVVVLGVVEVEGLVGRSLGAVLRRPGSSQYAPFQSELATPDPGPCSRPAHT
jgi:hypothetical protein